jgi:hypothetical protein
MDPLFETRKKKPAISIVLEQSKIVKCAGHDMVGKARGVYPSFAWHGYNIIVDTVPGYLEEKEQAGSIIITTQFPVDKWHLKLPDPTVADAICDRLTHGAIKLNLKGDSMRKEKEKSAPK